MANQDLIYGRSTVAHLTNQSGSARSVGDVVIIDTANNESFTTSASSNISTRQLGIVDEPISVGSNGRVVVEGYARQVNVNANTAARGDYLYQSTTAAVVAPSTIDPPLTGAFGQFLKGGTGTAPSAVVFPVKTAGTVSIGSNAMAVGATNQPGTSSLFLPMDHRHLGLHSITSSSSNTLDRPTVNFRSGANIGITASDSDGNGVFDTITISGQASGGGGGTVVTGNSTAVLPVGMPLVATTTNSVASQANAITINITAPMYVRSLMCDINTSNSGSIQWGIFDHHSSASAATKLVGGSAAPGGTGWRAIAATGAPVLIQPGGYMLITFNPAANSPTWQAATITDGAPWNHFQSSYTWTDTPDFTTGWGSGNTTFRICYLQGDLVSGTQWT